MTEAIINNGTTHNAMCLRILNQLASLSLHFDFSIVAQYIPGSQNVIADTISRLYEPSMQQKLQKLLSVFRNAYYLPYHISPRAILSLL